MKYFTKELWLSFQSYSEKDFKKNEKIWNANVKKYRKGLNKLLPNLSKRNQNFFNTVSLHDGRLLMIKTGDLINYKNEDLCKYYDNIKNVEVELNVLDDRPKYIYKLIYKNVRKCKVDYPSDNPLFFDKKTPFDDWGYDELLCLDNKYFSHEILFSSGAEIRIEFKQFQYIREKIKTAQSI